MSEQINSKSERIKIGLVQINNSFSNQNYFPYSIGFLLAYAKKNVKDIDKFEFLLPIYKRIPIDDAVKHLSQAEMVFFSTYIWNFKISSEIAKRIKQEKPGTIITFGGCQVPMKDIDEFMKQFHFVDIACSGEGERVFESILENYKNREWKEVPSVSYADGNRIITNPRANRIRNLREIPSPYLEGIFDPLIKANPEETWIGLWETNRGCPFGCSYCEWGGNYQKRLYAHDLEKILKEVDWFSENKIEFIFCCDANFGILERDLNIVKKVVENKNEYGYPVALSVQNTKNSTEKTYAIQKALAEAGLSKGVNLALQSLNPKTLKAVGRKNISNENFYRLQQKFNSKGIETFSDIILGLPEETYETFTKGISTLIEHGQHNRIQFNTLSLLPNSEMGNLEYQTKYGIQFVENTMINVHGSPEGDRVKETQKTVIGTSTMPPEDWVKTRAFGWMTSFLYFDKLLQLPLFILNKYHSVDYKDMIEAFLYSEKPVISKISTFFRDRARKIQKGDVEFCKSKKWLSIWWPVDELQMIEICTKDGELDRFYKESEESLDEILRKREIKDGKELIRDAITLNRNMIKLPFQDINSRVDINHNVWEFYRAQITGNPTLLERGKFSYIIDKTSQKWDSWEQWCKEVIWYGNKRGDYIYKCKPLTEK